MPDWDIHLRTLETAFLNLSSLTSDLFKLFFIVDGMDEYEGDGEQLAELFKTISSSPFIKVCLSSRPWAEFEDVFENYPSLRLQDLTCEDIRLYVQDKFHRNEKIQRLNRSNPHKIAFLTKNIVAKANGVFLWVRIVTKSLLDGLRNQDSIADLQTRLDELPADLSSLYNHIMSRISPQYIEQASRIFQIYDAQTSLDLKPSVLELELAVSANYTDTTFSSTRTMPAQEIDERCHRMVAHLKSRCVDLLEVHDHLDRTWESIDDSFGVDDVQVSTKVAAYAGQFKIEVDRVKALWKVTYLHRTVKDFLRTGQVRAHFQHHTLKLKGFDPNLSLLKSYVNNLKCSLRSFYITDGLAKEQQILKIARDFLRITSRVCHGRDQLPKLLVEFYQLTCQLVEIDLGLGIDTFSVARWRLKFLSMASFFGVWEYVQIDLRQHTTLPVYKGVSLLRYALNIGIPGELQVNEYSHGPDFNVVRTLLEYGADPNEVCGYGKSVWQVFLDQMASSWELLVRQKEIGIKYVQVVQELLSFDLAAGRRSLQVSDEHFKFLESLGKASFSTDFPKEAADLRSSLELWRPKAHGKRKQGVPEDLHPAKRQEIAFVRTAH
jgi:hypothetical protein